MIIIKKIFLILFLFNMTQAFAAEPVAYLTPADVNALPSKPADFKIAYGSGALQFGELRLPKGNTPFPVIIVIHGGCWFSKIATLQNTTALADALRDQGYATWNIEYRSADDTDGGWPNTFLDVAHATDHLQIMAKTYHLDLHRVVAVGHSAGGHLALWLAARRNLPTTSPLYSQHPLLLKGVVALAGVTDMKNWREHGAQVCGADGVSAVLGNSENTIDAHYLQASPIELLPLQTPQILIFGADDPIVPGEFSYNYTQLAKEKGDNVTVIIIKDAGHHELVAPHSVVWPDLLAAIKLLMNAK